jgi:hypothetical protein
MERRLAERRNIAPLGIFRGFAVASNMSLSPCVSGAGRGPQACLKSVDGESVAAAGRHLLNTLLNWKYP